MPGYLAANLSWTVGADNGNAITSFLVTWYHGGVEAGSTTVVAVPGAHSDLSPTPGALDTYDVQSQTGGVAVTFSVAATNGNGTGSGSVQTTSVTPSSSPTAPYAPTQVYGTLQSPGQIELHWTVPGDNGSAISAFNITSYLGGAVQSEGQYTGLDPTPGAQDSVLVTGFSPQSSFTFDVLALNGVGPSPRSQQSAPVNAGFFGVSPSTSSLDFGEVTLGDFAGPQSVTLTNVSGSPDTVENLSFSGNGGNDYAESNHCGTLAVGATCTVDVYFAPGALGERDATMTVNQSAPSESSPVVVTMSGEGGIGYYQVDAQGRVANFGDAGSFGDLSGTPLNKPIVGIAPTGDDGGYWLVATDGGVFNFGDAGFYGSAGSIRLNKPIVGMAATADAGGYWLVASDGGIFTYGDALFYGSTGAIHLNKPIVGMAPTPDGGGYWLVASDGGIFSYGDAGFYGSTGAIHLNQPIVGMAPTPDGGGYWLVASDGGIFSYGDAQFYGSAGSLHLNQPIVGMAAMPDGSGYWFTAADGGLFNYGDAPFYGAAAGQGLGAVVGMATDGAPTLQAFLNEPADRHGGVGPPAGTRHFQGP